MKTQIAMTAALCGCAYAAWGSGTNTWNSTLGPGGNTPITAYDWADSANWKTTTYSPGYWGDGAILASASPAPRFFKLPDLMRVTYIQYGTGNYLLGNFYFGDNDEGTAGARTSINPDTIIFGDFYTCSVKQVPYIAGFSIAGYFRDSHTVVDGRTPYSKCTNGDYNLGRTGDLTMRMDLWADSPDPVRAAPFQDNGFGLANAGFTFYGPRGADAQDSTWKTTAGSPYLKFTGTGNSGVVPGMVVTGAGIPTGGDSVFVKYVFRATGWIQLSADATADADAAALHFAAITPSVEQYFKTESGMQAGPHRMRVIKYREQDGCRLVYRDVNAYGNLVGRRWGLADSEVQGGWIPGDIVVSNATRSTSCPTTNWMSVCRFEFPTRLPNDAKAFWAGWSDCDARLTVREGDTGAIPRYVRIVGKMEKRGAGSLELGICEPDSTGALTVTEGTMALTSVNKTPLALATLKLAAGTTLALPEEGLAVGSFSAAAGVTIVGPGTLTLSLNNDESYDSDAVTLKDGAKIVVRSGGIPGAQIVAKPAANVVGHPAFWLDASQPDTITTNAAGEVTRWNDCRADEPMFCTNIVFAPLYVHGGPMTNNYVKIRRHASTYGMVTNTETLVWSVPVKDVRAVFLMHDPTDGGGDFLGRSSRLDNSYCGTQGGPFYRGSSSNRAQPIVYPKYGTACVTNGWFYSNGALVDARATGYPNAVMQLTEFHSNTNYPACAGQHWELWIDAFGTGYQDGGLHSSSSYFMDGENGDQRMAECIVYTNTLTYAERAQVAQYLMNKWLGKDVVYQEFDPRVSEANSGTLAAGNEEVDVEDGAVRFASSVSGTGDLVKSGDGLLYVYSLPSGGVNVQAGELKVRSLSLEATSVPGNAWVHFDASAAGSITTDASSGVDRWNDVRGNGMSLKPLVSGAVKASVTANALNGRAVVDLGAASKTRTAAAAFRLYANDVGYVHDNAYSSSGFINSPYIADMYFVAGSKRGGGSLLGCWGNGYPVQGLPHESIDPSSPILCLAETSTYWKWAFVDAGSLSPSISNDTTRVRVNGERVDPFVTPFSGGYDVFSFTHLQRKGDTFGTYGQDCSVVGGLEYGEILLYTNQLTDAEAAQVEAYLEKRWFNRNSAGYAVAEPASLFVASGAQATIVNATLLTSSLGGAGTIAGDVTLKENGALRVDVPESGEPEGPLTVNGTVALPAAGSIVFTGSKEKIQAGAYPLLVATSIVGSVADWTVPRPTAGLGARLAVENGELVLHVYGAGTLLIFR